MTIKELCEESHALAVSKGWYEGDSRNVGEVLALVHSELSEALEEYWLGHELQAVLTDDGGRPIGFPVALADAVIRIADMCGAPDIDLEAAIRIQHEYTRTDLIDTEAKSRDR